MNGAEPRHFHLAVCYAPVPCPTEHNPAKTPRGGGYGVAGYECLKYRRRIFDKTGTRFSVGNIPRLPCTRTPGWRVGVRPRTKDTVIRRRLGLSRVPLFMNVTRTLQPPAFYFCLARATTLKRSGMRGREGVSWWTGAKSDGERGCGLRVEVREESVEKREREKVRVRSKVRLLFMMLFPRNNRDFRKNAIAFPVDPFRLFPLHYRFWSRNCYDLLNVFERIEFLRLPSVYS